LTDASNSKHSKPLPQSPHGAQTLGLKPSFLPKLCLTQQGVSASVATPLKHATPAYILRLKTIRRFQSLYASFQSVSSGKNTEKIYTLFLLLFFKEKLIVLSPY